MTTDERLPHSKPSNKTASQKHADIDCASLNRCTNSDDDAHQLHEPNTTKLVSNCRLDEGPDGLTSDVDGHDLAVMSVMAAVQADPDIQLPLGLWTDGPCNQSTIDAQLLEAC